MPLSGEEDQAPEQKMEEQEEEPPAQARELALGLSIVRELHTSRVCALDGETERKLRISANVFRRRSSSWLAGQIARLASRLGPPAPTNPS